MGRLDELAGEEAFLALLTPRERHALRTRHPGDTNRDLAARLGWSLAETRATVAALLDKAAY